MIRGVDGRPIFTTDANREDFLSRFQFLVLDLGFLVLAWCLLDNHAHFVIQTGPTPLAVLMARLNSRHAQRLNCEVGRRGHLFQDRYRAVLITSEAQLRYDIAYVLGNPVRHGLLTMRALAVYPFSEYSLLVGARPARLFESPAAVAVALGMPSDRLSHFVHEIAIQPGGRSAALEPDQLDELDRLIRDCCRRHGIAENALRLADAGARLVRQEACALAARSIRLSIAEVAPRLGISYATAKRIYSEARRSSRA
jgi:REP element-mobilizing transposase RayT